jgi:hypothetical protein
MLIYSMCSSRLAVPSLASSLGGFSKDLGILHSRILCKDGPLREESSSSSCSGYDACLFLFPHVEEALRENFH